MDSSISFDDLALSGEEQHIDERLESVLHNLVALQFFNEFCLQEYAIENILYWIEVQVLKTMLNLDDKAAFAGHLYHTYVKEGSPLCLNLEAEVRKNVGKEFITEPQIDNLVNLQVFVLILIKQAAYLRFEQSKLFQNLLKFKKDGMFDVFISCNSIDRYAYSQGKIDWNYSLLNTKIDFMKTIKASRSLDQNSVTYREEVLLDTLARYFPRNTMAKNYFDDNERNKTIKRRRQLQKQKKLVKFFGFYPGKDQMTKQETNDQNTSFYSIFNDPAEQQNNSSKVNISSSNVENRKKVEKLKEFFGNQIPRKQIRKQNLLQKGIEYLSSITDESGISLEGEDDDIVGEVNNLTSDERAVLQKRAKKLLSLLGSDLDGKPITSAQLVSQQRASLTHRSPIAEEDARKSMESSVSSIFPSADHEKKVQKMKIDKLSSVMGERISENMIKDKHDDEDTPLPRPLSYSEKRSVQEKNQRLERLFGRSVPAENVINYAFLPRRPPSIDAHSVSDSMLYLENKNQILEERKRALLRIRKLRRILGSDIPMRE